MRRDDGNQVHRNGCHVEGCRPWKVNVAGDREGYAQAQAGDGQACCGNLHPKPSCHCDLHGESFQVRWGMNPIVLPVPEPVCCLPYKGNVSNPTRKAPRLHCECERATRAKPLLAVAACRKTHSRAISARHPFVTPDPCQNTELTKRGCTTGRLQTQDPTARPRSYYRRWSIPSSKTP